MDHQGPRRTPRPTRARQPRRTRARPARCVGPLRRTTKDSSRAQGLRLADRDGPIRTTTGLLPDRMGASGCQPQRVLRPPRGRTQSQRSRSSNTRPGNGRGTLAQRPSRVLVPRTSAPQRRTRASMGEDRQDRPSTARRTYCPHRRPSRRATALPLRPTGRRRCRGERARWSSRGRATSAVRHVTGTAIRHLVTIQVASGKAADFTAAFRTLQETALQEDGCEQYELFQSLDDPDKIVLLERWANHELLDKHLAELLVGPRKDASPTPTPLRSA